MVKPKYIVIARHGEYDKETKAGRLTPEGEERVRRTASKLKEKLESGLEKLTKIIFSSPTLRATQTAEIYAEVFDMDELNYEIDATLGITEENPQKIELATQGIEGRLGSGKADVYVFTTHEDTAVGVTNKIRRNFQRGKISEINALAYAEAVLINVENSTLEIVKP